MATVLPRQLKVGMIVDKAITVVEFSAMPALIFVVAFTALNVAITYFSLSLTAVMEQVGVGLAKFIVGVAAGYLMLDAMVQRTGLRSRPQHDLFFPFIGLSLLYILGVYAGFIALVIPGLVVMARWSIAQPMFLARGGRVTAALGESWERTRGAEIQIIGAALALLIIPLAIVIACSVMFDPADMVGIVVSQLATSVLTVVSSAMGVALYGMLVGADIGAATPSANDPRRA
jgi:hypothetical protein